jgi:hypothetical protein
LKRVRLPSAGIQVYQIIFDIAMADFDEKELLARAKTAFTLDKTPAGWDVLFEDMGFRAWRQVKEVLFSP